MISTLDDLSLELQVSGIPEHKFAPLSRETLSEIEEQEEIFLAKFPIILLLVNEIKPSTSTS